MRRGGMVRREEAEGENKREREEGQRGKATKERRR